MQPYSVIDMVDIHSNASLEAKGEGETWLGLAQKTSPDEFTFLFPGNLLGKAITAAATRTSYQGFVVTGGNAKTALPLCQSQGFLRQTSEFSDPIEVTR